MQSYVAGANRLEAGLAVKLRYGPPKSKSKEDIFWKVRDIIFSALEYSFPDIFQKSSFGLISKLVTVVLEVSGEQIVIHVDRRDDGALLKHEPSLC
jgi:hypothetical protein